jgi:SsrA-binding protein
MKSRSDNHKKIGQKNRVRLRMQEKSCTFARFMRLKSNVNIKNRRATFDYEVIERYTAGIQLFGTEIKSIRESKASLVDTYCQFVGNELWVKQMHIAEYRFGSYTNHEAKRDRKLLMTRKELRKLEKQVKDTGKTIIPLRLFINEKGFAKMEIALCQGKHTYDKRQALRAADDKRELQRAMKDFK